MNATFLNNDMEQFFQSSKYQEMVKRVREKIRGPQPPFWYSYSERIRVLFTSYEAKKALHLLCNKQEDERFNKHLPVFIRKCVKNKRANKKFILNFLEAIHRKEKISVSFSS